MQIVKLSSKGIDPKNQGAPVFTFELLHEASGISVQERLTDCQMFAWKMNQFAAGFRITDHFGIQLDAGWSFDNEAAAENNWTFVDPDKCVGLRAAAIIKHRESKTDSAKVFNEIQYPEEAPPLTCKPGTESLRQKTTGTTEAW